MIWWLISTSVVTVVHYLVVSRRYGLFSASSIFMLMHWLMVAGTIPQLVVGFGPDEDYAAVLVVPVLIFGLVSIAVAMTGGNNPRLPPRPSVKVTKPSFPIVSLFALSAIIVIGYFAAVGHNTFLTGLRGLLGGSEGGDIASLRRESYAGDTYFAPGYVNQFKNIFLPVLSVVIGHALYKRRSPQRNIFAITAGILSIVALLGTGQRSAFVVTVGVAAGSLYVANRKAFRRAAPTIVVAGMAVLSLSTLVLGRGSDEIDAQPTFAGKAWALVTVVTSRFTQINQESGRFAYWYTSKLPTENGREWLLDISGILPSSPGSDLANRVYDAVYGTPLGTEPPSLWGSVHYNFGWTGLILIPIFIAIIWNGVSRWGCQVSESNLLSVMGHVGVNVILGTWIMAGPSYLLNYGLVAFLVLVWLAKSTGANEPPSVGNPTPTTGNNVKTPSFERKSPSGVTK